MKKIAFLLVIALLLTAATPALASVYLSSLQINEEIIPSPSDSYLTVTGVLSNGVSQSITGDLTWWSSDYTIATVSSSGRVHFTGKGGPVTIAVRKDSASGSKTIYVSPWPTTLEIETNLIYSENPYRLMVKGKFSDGVERYFGPEDKLIWNTSNPFVAWVNSQGVVTFTGEAGYVNITASWGILADSSGFSVPDSAEGEGNIAYRTGIKIRNEEIKYSAIPITLKLVAILSDSTEEELSNSAADWSSNNNKVATINSEGELKFTGQPGFTIITVNYGGYTYQKTVSVDRFLDSLKIKESLNFTPNWEGVPLQLSVKGRYNDGTEIAVSSGITWAVDNKKVAAITGEGVLTFTGEAGEVTIKASAQGFGGAIKEDTILVKVPLYAKPKAQRFFISNNLLSSPDPLVPIAYCIYDDGSLRDITLQTQFTSLTPDSASIFQGKVYIAPSPGRAQVRATYQGLSDEVEGFVNILSGNASKIQQVRLKEHSVAFSYRPVKLTALAVMGNGSIKDVTSKVTWQTKQPLIAKVSKGVLTFTGRTGKAVIIMQGYGFRDELTVEVTPAELQPRVEKLSISGNFSTGANQLRAIATYNNGSEKDVTKEAVWNTDNREYAPVIQGIVMFPQGLKAVTVTAHYGGQEAILKGN